MATSAGAAADQEPACRTPIATAPASRPR